MKQVLIASPLPEVAEHRRRVLESEGFSVVTATSERQVAAICRKTVLDVVVIGYLFSPDQKLAIARAVRQTCKVPIIEMTQGVPCVPNAEYLLNKTQSEELARFLRGIRNPNATTQL